MYLFKQLVGVLVLPATIALLLVAAGLVLHLVERRAAARRVFLAGVLLAYLGSISIVGDALVAPLERQYPAVADDAVPAAAFIVVLGGGYLPRDEVPITAELNADGLARIVEGVRLARQLPQATLIVSGGAPAGTTPSAHGYAVLALDLGIDRARVIVHDTPHDTAEEARAIAARIGREPFLLVTSASHMPRAMRRMEAAGALPVPAPTAHQAVPSTFNLWKILPTGSGMSKTERAVHEYVGLLALALGFD